MVRREVHIVHRGDRAMTAGSGSLLAPSLGRLQLPLVLCNSSGCTGP